MNGSENMMREGHPQTQSRLLTLPGEVRNLIWRAVVPYREYYLIVAPSRRSAKSRRVKHPQHLSLLLSCRQICEEAATLKTNRTLNLCGWSTLPATLWGNLGDHVDELIHDATEEDCEEDHEYGLLDDCDRIEEADLQEYWSDILSKIAEDTVWFKEAYLTVRFDRFKPVRCDYDFETQETLVEVEWFFKVDGRRPLGRRVTRRDYVVEDSETYGDEIQKEKTTLRARGVDQWLKDLVLAKRF